MTPAILVLMLLVAVVAAARALVMDLAGTVGAVLIALLVLGLLATHNPKGCVQKRTCGAYHEAIQNEATA